MKTDEATKKSAEDRVQTHSHWQSRLATYRYVDGGKWWGRRRNVHRWGWPVFIHFNRVSGGFLTIFVSAWMINRRRATQALWKEP